MTRGLLQPADQVPLLVVAGIVVPVGTLALGHAAHQRALLAVAGVVVHVALDLGQRAHEVSVVVVAATVVRVGHRPRNGAVQHLLLARGGAAVLAQRQRNARGDQQRDAREDGDDVVTTTLCAVDPPDALPGPTLHGRPLSTAAVRLLVLPKEPGF